MAPTLLHPVWGDKIGNESKMHKYTKKSKSVNSFAGGHALQSLQTGIGENGRNSRKIIWYIKDGHVSLLQPTSNTKI
jgi:hypothetical protein